MVEAPSLSASHVCAHTDKKDEIMPNARFESMETTNAERSLTTIDHAKLDFIQRETTEAPPKAKRAQTLKELSHNLSVPRFHIRFNSDKECSRNSHRASGRSNSYCDESPDRSEKSEKSANASKAPGHDHRGLSTIANIAERVRFNIRLGSDKELRPRRRSNTNSGELPSFRPKQVSV